MYSPFIGFSEINNYEIERLQDKIYKLENKIDEIINLLKIQPGAPLDSAQKAAPHK